MTSERPSLRPSPAGGTLYRPADFYLLRTPLLPVQEFLALGASGNSDEDAAPDGRSEGEPARLARLRREGRKLLRQAAARPRIAQALHIGSASVTAGLGRLAADPEDDKRARRAYSTLLRYVTRMATRPTPYGLFAGVTTGLFTEDAGLALGRDPVARTRTRADLGWLLALLKETESDPAVRAQLPVTVNPGLYRVGDRAVLPVADVYGEEDNRLADFRITAPAELALRLARVPGTTYARIVDRIARDIPGATHDKAAAFLAQLWDLHALTSELRPSLSEPLPELALAGRLEAIPAARDVVAGLHTVRTLAGRIDAGRGTAPVSRLTDLTAHQRAMTPGYTGETYQLDTALAVTGTGLPAEVGAAAAEAAETLLRLGSHPPRPQHIAEYHAAFLERYGVDSEVPLLELLSPEAGLDAPTPYTAPARAFPLPPVGEDRDRMRELRLAALAAEALSSGAGELEITDERLEQLSVWRAGEHQPRVRPALDLYVQVAAGSAEALRGDDWRLVLAPAGMAEGGRTFGRFFDLLDDETLERLRGYARAEEEHCPGTVFAELNYLHPHGRSGNVALHPRLRTHEICVNTAPTVEPAFRIALDDILVGATANRFFLRSARLGRELVVTQSHMLTATQAPNVCRLLLELSEDGFAPLAGFDWGPMACAPFLPRVTRGRAVLHPAQWSLTAERLGLAAGAPLPGADAFHALVSRWRAQWNVPRYVYLVWMDNRLMLDLEHPLATDELREELSRLKSEGRVQLTLHEAMPGFPGSWLRDPDGGHYLNEVVVPLLSRDPAHSRRSAVPTRLPAGPGRAPGVESTAGITDLVQRFRAPRESRRSHPAGGEWTYLKLYGAATRHEDVIAGPLRELVGALRADGLVDRWFFLRYADPMPHLRIRFRASRDEHAATLLTTCLAWANGLIETGLAADVVLAGYERELERYGGPEAMDAAERVFEADSDVCAELVAARRLGGLDLDAEALCVLAMHTLYRDWGSDPLDSRPTDRALSDGARKHFRRIQRTLCDLLVPWDAHPDSAARQYAPALERILVRQQSVLAEAGGLIRELAGAGRLVGDEQRMLASLAHMRANRFLGMGQERERLCHELWAQALEAIRRRPALVTAGRGTRGA
ncbi:lantibiotic dehydratase [Streptomyces sp. SYSU K21746]